MIVVSTSDKIAMQDILSGYSRDRLDTVLSRAISILQSYYPVPPLKLGRRLLDRLFSSWLNKPNEAFIQYWMFCKLVFEYGYPTEQIDVEVSCGEIGRRAISNKPHSTSADIVVFSHESRRPGTAIMVIECRELGGPNGSVQAASYSRALQARYHLFTDSNLWQPFRTMPHPVDGISIGDIPHWIGSKPIQKRLPKSHLLPPLTDEKQLRDLIKSCHDTIHSEGVDPAKAFDELVKLFFVKVYDEQEIPDEYQFSVLEGETADIVGHRLRDLLKQAKDRSKYRELFSEPGDDEFWISNESIRKVVETFQGFSFTGDTLIGIDVKGTVYENMVGSTFRGELGQYFTPRKIVEFMVSFLEPNRDDIVFDPACGSGGFLIHVLRAVSSQVRAQQQNLPQPRTEILIGQFANNNIYGSDISPRMIRASRMNMIMHGDGWSGIQRCHGLRLKDYPFFLNKLGNFSLVLSNPPFAGFETDETILQNFITGKNEAGRVRGVNRAIVFVEQVINIMREGGRAGLVLPRSIFENESYSFKKLRQIIYDRCEILGVVGLPKTAFHHTDCGILGDLLFIQKKSQPRENYDVFMGWADEVGYNTLGHNIERNDLIPGIINLYRQKSPDNMFPFRRLQSNDNINPWHYHPKSRHLRTQISKHSELVPLVPVLASVYRNRISRSALRQTPERLIPYVEVRDVDPLSGKFTSHEHKISTLPSRATYEMNGDEVILLPNARNSLESKRRIIKTGEELRGITLTNRFTPLIPNVNPEYLVMMLNTDFVRNQLIEACRGAGSPDLRESKLFKIMVPVPEKEDLSSIDSFIENIMDKISRVDELMDDLQSLRAEIKESFESLYENK